MEYIAFTEEEKERAGAVNLVEFLTRQGEEMEPSGSEWRWKRHDSVTVRVITSGTGIAANMAVLRFNSCRSFMT